MHATNAGNAVEKLTLRGSALIDRIEREVPDADRTWKPAPRSWSLTEVVEHLSLVASGMLRTARQSNSASPQLGALKSAVLRSVLRSPLRFPVPVAAVVPRTGVSWSDARRHLLDSGVRWTTFAVADSPASLRFRHPLVGKLTPTETADFLVEHFDHHMRQIQRLFAALQARNVATRST
ncbi:MAG: DinB family protein [Gemmatimonadota bacterium]|nr:DinB family protein [Gemmatimonadota bacterium]